MAEEKKRTIVASLTRKVLRLVRREKPADAKTQNSASNTNIDEEYAKMLCNDGEHQMCLGELDVQTTPTTSAAPTQTAIRPISVEAHDVQPADTPLPPPPIAAVKLELSTTTTVDQRPTIPPPQMNNVSSPPPPPSPPPPDKPTSSSAVNADDIRAQMAKLTFVKVETDAERAARLKRQTRERKGSAVDSALRDKLFAIRAHTREGSSDEEDD